jgi:hypothetical protein
MSDRIPFCIADAAENPRSRLEPGRNRFLCALTPTALKLLLQQNLPQPVVLRMPLIIAGRQPKADESASADIGLQQITSSWAG